MKRAVLLTTDDWEGLYLDGKLIDQGHTIEEGDSLYYLKLAERYNLNSSDFYMEHLEDCPDSEMVLNIGGFPDKLNDLQGNYGEE